MDRSAEDVLAYVTDPSRFCDWQEDVVDGHMDAADTRSVAARCVTIRRIGLANRPITAELAYLDPPRTWGVRGVDGLIRATVEPLGENRSHLTIAVDFDGHGIGRVLVPLVVRREARREMPANPATPKERLERQA